MAADADSKPDTPPANEGNVSEVAPAPHRAELSPWSRVFWLIIVLVGAGLLAYGGFLWTTSRAINAVDRGMENAKEAVIGIAEAFQADTISQTFMEFTALEAEGNEGNILEVATAEATETFTRITNVVWFERVMPLGTTVSEVSVPATYRYHIDLNSDWSLAAYDDRILVIAPRLEPSLPVAFDHGKMKRKTRSGWGRWDGDANLAALESTLTTQLAVRASADETIDSIREEARVSVAKFLKNWLIDHGQWGEGRYRAIVVVFEDEIGEGGDGNLTDLSDTLKLDPPNRPGGKGKAIIAP